MKHVRAILSSILLLLLLFNSLESQSDSKGSSVLFPCLRLLNAHYNYLKTLGESVNLTCPRNCSAEGSTTWWHHSFVRVKTDLKLLLWNVSSHLAALTEIPSHESVGFFCCGCDEDEDPTEDSCCWGVAYQPVVNLSITVQEDVLNTDQLTTIVPVGTNLSLRCEVRGFPFIKLQLTPPTEFDISQAQCHEVGKSWYSTVYTCQWTAAESDSGRFDCTGTILMDSVDNKKVNSSASVSHQLIVYRIPRLVRLYQASATGSRLDIACEIDCSPISRCIVVWYFESRAVDPETSKYDTSSDGSVHLLSVQQPGEGDLGRYSCVLRSQFSEEEEDDRRTITVALPDGVTGSPLGELPGPVDDRNDPGRRKMTVGLIASVVTIAASSVIVAVGVLYLAVRRISARNIGKPTRVDSADRESLVPSAADDDTFKDGVVTSSRSKKNAKAQRTIPMTQLVRARRPRND